MAFRPVWGLRRWRVTLRYSCSVFTTSFGDHVEVGLHAVAVDEHRRPFVATFWTIPRGQKPKGHVEQTWFAGAHCNVGARRAWRGSGAIRESGMRPAISSLRSTAGSLKGSTRAI
jgi:hypothetical protein